MKYEYDKSYGLVLGKLMDDDTNLTLEEWRTIKIALTYKHNEELGLAALRREHDRNKRDEYEG